MLLHLVCGLLSAHHPGGTSRSILPPGRPLHPISTGSTCSLLNASRTRHWEPQQPPDLLLPPPGSVHSAQQPEPACHSMPLHGPIARGIKTTSLTQPEGLPLSSSLIPAAPLNPERSSPSALAQPAPCQEIHLIIYFFPGLQNGPQSPPESQQNSTTFTGLFTGALYRHPPDSPRCFQHLSMCLPVCPPGWKPV